MFLIPYNECIEHKWLYDLTQLGRFRKALGNKGVEELLACTMKVAVPFNLIARKELMQLMVDPTVQLKAVAHPTDSDELLDTVRVKVVEAAKVTALRSCEPMLNRVNGWPTGCALCPSNYTDAKIHLLKFDAFLVDFPVSIFVLAYSKFF